MTKIKEWHILGHQGSDGPESKGNYITKTKQWHILGHQGSVGPK